MKNNIHIERLKAIRPFVNFNYNLKDIKAGKLSAHAKRKIKLYFDSITEATSQPTYAYKPRNKSHRDAAFDYANQDNLKGLKVVFIPVPMQGMKPELKFNKNGLTVKTGYVSASHVTFNKMALVQNREKEVERALSKFPEKYKRFTVQCGKFERLVSSDRDSVDRQVMRLMEKYDDKEKNNYFGKWLNGLFAYEFDNQADPNSFMAAKSRARKNLQKNKKNKKRREKYAKSK